MYRFGKSSKVNLSQADPDLQRLFNEVIKYVDCTILCGFRSKTAQEKAVADGVSKLHFPNSKHNQMPSQAVDAVPFYPDGIRWNDKQGFYFFAGLVKGIAAMLGIKIRWGGDWDSDNDTLDQNFNDFPHFELIK